MCPTGNDNLDYKRIDLMTTKQTLTANYVDYGAEIPCLGFRSAQVYLQITINNGTDVTIAAFGLLEKAGIGEYNMPLQVDGTAEVNVDLAAYNINYDLDGYQMFRIDLQGVPFLQLQAKNTLKAGAPADLEHCIIILTK